MKIAVVGQGYVGLNTAILFAEAGNTVVGIDSDKSVVMSVSGRLVDVFGISASRIAKLDNYSISSDYTGLSDADAVIIAVPTPLSNGMPDLSHLISAVTSVLANISKDSAIIIESTCAPFTLRNTIYPIVQKSNHKILLGVSPERIDPGNHSFNISNISRLVAGIDDDSATFTYNLYSKICSNVVMVSSPEVAEAAKIFENTFRLVNISLVNEVSKVLNGIGISPYEVLAAANTKPYGIMKFDPSAGAGGHCIPIDPTYFNYMPVSNPPYSEFIGLSNSINDSMPEWIVDKISNYLDGLNGKKIQVVGISYKPNVPDTRESAAIKVLKLLADAGASVTWHDEVVRVWNGQISEDLDDDVDLGIILVNHTYLKLDFWNVKKISVVPISNADLIWNIF